MEHNLFIIYRFIEYISLIHVLAILRMKIVLPLRWLAGKCEHLSKWEFGVADMPDVVDLMDKASAKIQRDGRNIMDDTFMFIIFNKIAKNVKPFEEYMEYMFEHNKISPIRSLNNEEKVTPWELLCCDMMFPTHRDIIQSKPMTVEVGVHVAIIFCEELRDENKATAKY